MKYRGIVRRSLFFLFLSGILQAVLAHGTHYEVVREGVFGIYASYDGGAPIADAEVLVFPPGKTTPCCTTATDGRGFFAFVPPSDGTWIFQVRDKTGHGMRINLPIDDSQIVKTSGSGVTPTAKVLMVVSIVWGAVGTALYFSGRRKAVG